MSFSNAASYKALHFRTRHGLYANRNCPRHCCRIRFRYLVLLCQWHLYTIIVVLRFRQTLHRRPYAVRQQRRSFEVLSSILSAMSQIYTGNGSGIKTSRLTTDSQWFPVSSLWQCRWQTALVSRRISLWRETR